MKFLLHIAISLLFFSHNCFAQVVWPGDVNNNGIVNEVDLLYLGFAFNETGSPRMSAGTDWIGQDFTAWDGTFPDGLNFAYADCNGDGIVDEADAAVIQMNLTQIHNDVLFVVDEILEAIPEIDPQFAFTPNELTVQAGSPVDLLISLASDEMPFNDLSGLAFTINYDSKFFQANSPKFELLPTAWIDPFGNENTNLILDNPEEGKITVAFTTTDKKPVSGGGFIGTVSFIIVEDIIDFLVQDDTIKVAIDSITVVTDGLGKVPVVGATAIIDIEGRTTSTYDPILDKIKLYPNPTNGWILLQTNEVPVEKVELINQLGQLVYHKRINKADFHSLDLQAIPEGMYWLRMITQHGTKSVPIQRL